MIRAEPGLAGRAHRVIAQDSPQAGGGCWEVREGVQRPLWEAPDINQRRDEPKLGGGPPV